MIVVTIVNYLKCDRVVENLKALRKQTLRDRMKIVVVDNSVDERNASVLRAAIIEGETLIVADSNLGYTRACNIAVEAVDNPGHVLLLNPDIILDDPTTIERLVAMIDADSSIGALAPIQRDDDGSLVETARRFPTVWKQVARRLRPGSFTDYDLLAPLHRADSGAQVTVDWAQSSFLVVRKGLWETIGGLDTRYKIFMADVKLGKQIAKLTLRVVITSVAYVRADGLRASRGGFRTLLSSRAQRIHVRDALVYALMR